MRVAHPCQLFPLTWDSLAPFHPCAVCTLFDHGPSFNEGMFFFLLSTQPSPLDVQRRRPLDYLHLRFFLGGTVPRETSKL